MFYFYILRSLKNKQLYLGFTPNLKKRLKSHNAGENKSTKAFIPLELIHYEAYRNMKDAKRREMYLKSNRGRTTLITMLKEYFDEKR